MERRDLAGTWTLVRLADGSERPIALPGDLMSALIESGELADPYVDRNELAAQWVGREDWLLRRDFEADAALLSLRRVVLQIEALDTMAELALNGIPIGKSANMFRRFRADIAGLLRPGTNRLEILIRSPEQAALAEAAALPYPVPWSVYPVSSPHRNLIRKAQCMSGWDWGPCLMTGGVYDGIALLGGEGPLIAYATVRSFPEGSGWRVEASAELDLVEAAEVELRFELAGARVARGLRAPAGLSTHTETLHVMGVERWWPSGYGEQPLYPFSASVKPKGGDEAGAHRVEKRVGFRELTVVAQADAIGRSFLFRVNGRAIFAKGANWIPADALPSRWTRARLEDLLDSAVDANMNCLRVWGGGRYESEAFYELCDEKGLMVWQDCMFSCALYPSSPAFLAEVDAEIVHQVKRLKDHPSIALWCGNNEALGAITWYEASKKNPARYIVDYDRLNEGVLGRRIRELDPDRTWWPSSPSAGPDDFSDNWHADDRGDMHYWSVWHEGKPFSAYLEVQPRFCSEFGFQSFPSLRTARSFAPEGQLNPTSPAFEHHQRHERGNTLILETMSRYFRMPSGFANTLYLSQVQQALAIGTAVEFWRSLKPRCMGTLYWQLNDVWPVASWSSLEYDGGPKLLHHEARRFYDPTLLALILKDGRAALVVVEDGSEARDFRLLVELRRFDGSVAASWTERLSVPGEAATLVWERPLDALAPAGLAPLPPDTVFLCARMEGMAPSGGTPLVRRLERFLTEPKRCDLVDPKVQARVEVGGEGLEVVLTSAAPAFYVALETEKGSGRFADGGFCVLPGEERRVRYRPAPGEATEAAALSRALSVRDLYGSFSE